MHIQCRKQEAHLLLHRPAVGGGAQPQLFLGRIIEIADGDAGHMIALSMD